MQGKTHFIKKRNTVHRKKQQKQLPKVTNRHNADFKFRMFLT